MEELNIYDMSIPKEDFEFAQNENITDKKFDTKPIGFLKDALIRFRKNKGSVVAFFVIMLIVLYALIVPFCVPSHQATQPDSYYARMAPRNTALKESLGIMGGFKDLDGSEQGLVFEYAKGVAAESYDGRSMALKDAYDSYYNPVFKVNYTNTVMKGKTVSTNYNFKVDTYLQVGFIYKTVTLEEYNALEAWEAETGLHVLYPLIDKYTADGRDGKYSLDIKNANYWYKMKTTGSEKGVPISTTIKPGKVTTLQFSDDLVLEDNYYRVGGEIQKKIMNGSSEHQSYEVRLLYYNYYRYLRGAEPNYFFGTDTLGLDFAYRLGQGLRLSLIFAVVISVINFILGALYGAVEGYYGGATDMILERVSDILAGIPFIIVATLFQMHLAKKAGPIPSLIFAYVLTGWIGTASRVRTQFYRFKNEEYVMAARTLGASDRRLIWKHIFPNTLGTIITSIALVIPGVIFSESSLSFLGIVNLGTTKSTSLGTLLSESSTIWTSAPHLMLFPSIFISLLMICFNLFGNGLRDAFNPSLRGVEE